MSLNVHDLTHSSNVVSTGNIAEFSRLILNCSCDLSFLEVVLDGVSFVDVWVRESDGSGIIGDDVGDLVRTNSFSLNF